MKKLTFLVIVLLYLFNGFAAIAQCPDITGITSICISTSTTLSNAAGGTWSSSNTSVATVGLSTGIVSGIAPGRSVITYSGSCGSITTTVTVNTASPGAIIGTSSLCSNQYNELSDAVAGGMWSSSNIIAGTMTQDGVLHGGQDTGTTVITYSTGCGTAVTKTVTTIYRSPTYIYSSLPIGPSAHMNICLGGITTLSNDALPVGTWTSSNPSVATVNTTTGLVTTTGVAGVTDITVTNTCIFISRHFLLVADTPTAISGMLTLCQGINTTTLSNGTAGGTWSSGNPALATIDPIFGVVHVVPPGGTGTVPIRYNWSAGCYKDTTLTIVATLSIGPANAHICVGGTITLSSSSPGGTWSSSNTSIATVVTTTGTVSGVSPGTAIISYSIGGVCMTSATVTIDVDGTTYTLAAGVHICAGSTVVLSDAITGGAWSSSNTAIATVSPAGAASATVKGISAGTATITYGSGACSATLTSVSVTAQPSVMPGLTDICTGSVIVLSSNPGGGTWSSDNTAAATINAGGAVTTVSTGTAHITYTLSGCVATATVNVIGVPLSITGLTHTCIGGYIALSDAATGGVWSSGATGIATVNTGTGLVTGVSAGNAIITYSLSGGCFITTTVTIDPRPDAGVITGAAGVCVGATITLSNTVSGGIWSSSNSTAVLSPPIVTGVLAGVDTIRYVVSNGSCADTATKEIHVYAVPDAGMITGPVNVCVGATITLSNAASGGVWSSSNTNAVIIPPTTISGVSPGADTIRYIVNNGFCADTAVYMINVYAAPVAGIITGDSVLCAGSVTTLSDNAPGGVWSSVFVSIATVSGTGKVSGVAAGIDTIKYTVSNPACSAIAIKTVTVYNSEDPGVITGRDEVCIGTAFTLTDTVAGGVWTSTNIPVVTIDATSGNAQAIAAGAVVIKYTVDAVGGMCATTATFTVTVLPPFIINSTVSQISCYGANDGGISLTINGSSSSYSFAWVNGSTSQTISGLAAGVYAVTVTEDATLCMESDSFRVTEPDSLSVSAETTKDMCKSGTGSIITTVRGGTVPYTYLWPDNSTGAGLQNLHAGIYLLTLTDANSCVKKISISVNEDTCGDIIIHDVITPNGDGYNDVWVIEGIHSYPANAVRIFDKWGDEVYGKTNYNNDWDGTGKSGALPDGTYFYLVKLNMKNGAGGKDTFTGTVLIKR